MEDQVSLAAALRALRDTGQVRLPGKPAVWSSALRVLTMVLMTLVSLLAVGGLAFAVVAPATGAVRVTGGTIFGAIGVFAMLTVVMVLLVLLHRRQKRLRAVERDDVVIDARGLRLRGVGPIPWHEFGPAQHQLVPAEHDSRYTRRAVMALTPAGRFTVNNRLPAQLRDRVSPPHGPIWNRQHSWIYVPGVDGLRQAEVMQLINTAHAVFSGHSRP